MTDKKPTIAALQRKIERLEATIEALQEQGRKAWDGYGDALHREVDMKLRARQAIRLLQGEDA